MYHQGHNNVVSSREAFPPERHLLLQQWGSIPDASGLVLSTDSKPRLKWTPELHHKFIEAVNQLGGADKATPKAVMRLMGIPGLTLYHLKSHLQKYRLSKNLQPQANMGSTKSVVGCKLAAEMTDEGNSIISAVTNTNIVPQPKPVQINEALQMQIEVQRQLKEQLEVQRHLQLRIEAQGKYLQSVLEKAQETLGKQNLGSPGLEAAKVQLSELISEVSNECFSNAFPGDYERASVSACKFEARPLSSKAQRGGAISEAWHKERRAEAIFLEHPHSKKHAEQQNRGKESTSFGIAGRTAQLDLNADEDDGDGTERKFDLNGFSWA